MGFYQTLSKKCWLCGKPLTEAERDAETGHLYSAHWGCKAVKEHGFVVLGFKGETLYGPYEFRAYAESKAVLLADANPGCEFEIREV